MMWQTVQKYKKPENFNVYEFNLPKFQRMSEMNYHSLSIYKLEKLSFLVQNIFVIFSVFSQINSRERMKAAAKQ